MDVRETLGTIREAISSTRVFSEPYEVDGVTIITASFVRGGGGGGGAPRPGGEGEAVAAEGGGGGGFGLVAGPAGAYVIREGKVSWQPAVDVTRIVLGSQLLVLVLALVLNRMLRAGLRRKRRGLR